MEDLFGVCDTTCLRLLYSSVLLFSNSVEILGFYSLICGWRACIILASVHCTASSSRYTRWFPLIQYLNGKCYWHWGCHVCRPANWLPINPSISSKLVLKTSAHRRLDRIERDKAKWWFRAMGGMWAWGVLVCVGGWGLRAHWLMRA